MRPAQLLAGPSAPGDLCSQAHSCSACWTRHAAGLGPSARRHSCSADLRKERRYSRPIAADYRRSLPQGAFRPSQHAAGRPGLVLTRLRAGRPAACGFLAPSRAPGGSAHAERSTTSLRPLTTSFFGRAGEGEEKKDEESDDEGKEMTPRPSAPGVKTSERYNPDEGKAKEEKEEKEEGKMDESSG
eukprot:tig00001181_g7428.t1